MHLLVILLYSHRMASLTHVCMEEWSHNYQKATPDAFGHTLAINLSIGLEGPYIDGLSITHGAAGSRQHIWSFAAAVLESDLNFGIHFVNVCPCTNTDFTWPYQVPSFIGNNYFCDTGNPGPGYSFTEVYTDDPLWDGEGCGPTSTCCQFNTPPWFCATLPQPTTDDIEIRMCLNEPMSNEDIYTELIEIYTM